MPVSRQRRRGRAVIETPVTTHNNNSRQQKNARVLSPGTSEKPCNEHSTRASHHNNFQLIPLSRPRIERAVDCDGFYVIRNDHGWLRGEPPPSSC
jgi:hypothetical protein